MCVYVYMYYFFSFHPSLFPFHVTQDMYYLIIEITEHLRKSVD